jgi:integrase
MRLAKYRGVWSIIWREEGKTKRRSLGTNDRGEAERRYEDVKRESAREADQGTIADVYSAYTADLAARGKPIGRTQFAWKRLAPTFGALRPDQVTRIVCRQYAKTRLNHGVTDGTIWTELGWLRTALNWSNPKTPAVIERPQKPPPKDRFLTKEEYRWLKNAAVSDHLRLFIVLGIATAGRKGAILGLTWDRIDFDRGQIDLGKGVGNKGRAVIPMTGNAREALTIAYDGRTCDHVIEYGGKAVAKIDKAFKRTVVRAGIGSCTPHDLRRSAARWMAEAGQPMTAIAQYLGHSNTAQTEKVYARYSPTFLAGAAEALDV